MFQSCFSSEVRALVPMRESGNIWPTRLSCSDLRASFRIDLRSAAMNLTDRPASSLKPTLKVYPASLALIVCLAPQARARVLLFASRRRCLTSADPSLSPFPSPHPFPTAQPLLPSSSNQKPSPMSPTTSAGALARSTSARPKISYVRDCASSNP